MDGAATPSRLSERALPPVPRSTRLLSVLRFDRTCCHRGVVGTPRRAAASKRKAKGTRFAAVRVDAAPVEGTIEIDLANGLIRVRGIVDAGMLREVLAAAR